MQAIIYEPKKGAGRIKIFIPYKMTEYRYKIKAMDSSFWHPVQKLWSVVNTLKNMEKIKEILGNNYKIKTQERPHSMPVKDLSVESLNIMYAVEKSLILKRYSSSTIKCYKSMLVVFLSYFDGKQIESLNKSKIEAFVHQMIEKHKISASTQNQLINAVKFYYEQVLGNPREYYDIQRPKKEMHLPNVLSEEEVFRIINQPKNLKHKTILWTIYSAGLRISEATRLRMVDIHDDEGYILVKGGKGKKDRKTILSSALLSLLKQYYKKYRSSYWLFEGQTGGQYSVTSIRAIFRRAVKETNSNPWATVHTLRHSFATHCVQNNVHMRHLQNMLGHNSPKTTEIYTKTIQINNKNVTSPLDVLLKRDKFSH